MWSSRIAVSAMMIAAAFFVFIAQASGAVNWTARPNDGGWIIYNIAPLKHAQVYVQQLARTADGSCDQRIQERGITLHPGDTGVAWQWVAYNPSTCQVRVERGQPPDGFEK